MNQSVFYVEASFIKGKQETRSSISRWSVSHPLHRKRWERNYMCQLCLQFFALSLTPSPIPKTLFAFPVLRAHLSSGLSSKSFSGSLRNEVFHHRGAAVTLPLCTPAQTHHKPHHRICSRSVNCKKNRITGSLRLQWHDKDHILSYILMQTKDEIQIFSKLNDE